MDVSVIIVNWNTRELLVECLRSLVRERSPYQMEIIVVDNGSEDFSQEAVRTEFPQVKLIENGANLGFARANNVGIRQSNGRYVCIVNSDVKVLDGCIDTLCGYMDQNPSVGIVGPKILWPDMTLQDSCRKFPSLWNNFCTAAGLNRLFRQSKIFSGEHMLYFSHNLVYEADFLAGCFLMIRKQALNQVGIFDEGFFIYSEEIDLCKRFWKNGWKVKFFPGASAVHNVGASSSRAPLRFYLELQRSKLRYWKKHHNRLSFYVFYLLVLVQHSIRFIAWTGRWMVQPRTRQRSKEEMIKNIICLRLLLSLDNNRSIAI